MNKDMTILSRDDQTVLSDRFQANQHFTSVYKLWTWGMLRKQGTRRILRDSQIPAGSESLVADKRHGVCLSPTTGLIANPLFLS